MSVLIDTSVWVDHFRRRNEEFVKIIEADQALMHPMVLAELACGTPPKPRAQTLRNVSLLRSCNQATVQEVIDFIERHQLYGLGCGYVDMSLLASTLITPGAQLWTLDKRLEEMAKRLGVNYQVSAQ